MYDKFGRTGLLTTFHTTLFDNFPESTRRCPQVVGGERFVPPLCGVDPHRCPHTSIGIPYTLANHCGPGIILGVMDPSCFFPRLVLDLWFAFNPKKNSRELLVNRRSKTNWGRSRVTVVDPRRWFSAVRENR